MGSLANVPQIWSSQGAFGPDLPSTSAFKRATSASRAASRSASFALVMVLLPTGKVAGPRQFVLNMSSLSTFIHPLSTGTMIAPRPIVHSLNAGLTFTGRGLPHVPLPLGQEVLSPVRLRPGVAVTLTP